MEDFVYLDVAGLASHYSNPTESWPEIVRSLAQTELTFFLTNALLKPEFEAPKNVAELVIRYSDFNDEGRAFVMSQAIERWLASCDRKGTVDAYRDPRGLNSRLAKFRKNHQNR
jgi:hypothetical protein